MQDRKQLALERFRQVEQWMESGERPGEFSERAGISPETLRKGRKRYEAETGRRLPQAKGGRAQGRGPGTKQVGEDAAPFIPVALLGERPRESQAPLVAELVLPGDTRLRVHEHFDAEEPARLILEGIDLRGSRRRHSWQQACRKPA